MDRDVGIDIENSERFIGLEKEALEAMFCDKEIEYCYSRQSPEKHLAARFAAKEAVIKAYHSLRGKYLKMSEIEILKSESGNPYVNMSEKNVIVKLSMAMSGSFAVATAVVYENC